MRMRVTMFAGTAAAVLLTFSDSGWAAPITVSTYFSPSQVIPDNDPTGLALTEFINIPGVTTISDLRVTLEIEGGYMGDYYAYLRHGQTGFAVLLNRVGISSDPSGYGYPDSTLDVTLSSDAANGDIHFYRSVLNPDGGLLTGFWQPDGRNADPSLVMDSTKRSALLDSFNGLDPNGAWTLFIADNSPLGVGMVEGWGLTVTANGVPELGGTFGLLTLSLASLVFLQSARLCLWRRPH